MKTFTKLFFVVTLISSHFLSYAADIKKDVADNDAREGVSPVTKGNNTLWKLVPEKRQGQGLTLSAQNSRPAFVANENGHTCSKIYASAVSSEFHGVETANINKGMYSAITLAAFAPGRDLRPVPTISAYPNPSRGRTRLSLTQTGGDNYKVKLSNTIGRVISTLELPTAPDNAAVHLDMDMSGYPAGVYFYSLLVNDKTVETKRLVLQK